MFRILLAAFLGSLLVSCSNGYKIDGKTSVSCLDGRMFYLMTFSENSTVIDSAEIVHGQFEMEGNLDSSMLAMAFMDNRLLMPVVLFIFPAVFLLLLGPVILQAMKMMR